MSDTIRALVTGASRGVGRGVAEALGEAGARVVVTGREPGALSETVARVESLGGSAVALPCDLTDDDATCALFERAGSELGGLDLLVNSAWAGYERMVENGLYTWEAPFWEQPLWRWDAMFGGGVRAAYACSRLAAHTMVSQGNGLIVNVSYFAAKIYMQNVAYGVAKCATDRVTADTAHELEAFGVSVVSLYPGLVRTERVMEVAEHFDLSNSESPRFTGRAVVALLSEPDLAARSGRALIAAEVCREHGVADVDGARPRPLMFDRA